MRRRCSMRQSSSRHDDRARRQRSAALAASVAVSATPAWRSKRCSIPRRAHSVGAHFRRRGISCCLPISFAGLALERNVRRRVRVVPNVTAIAASGPGRVETLELETAARCAHSAGRRAVLHQGMVPDINLGGALGCAQRWNDAQACFEPSSTHGVAARFQAFSSPATLPESPALDAAEARGHLAALAVANALGRIDAKARDAAAERPRELLRRALRSRVYLDALHRPADAYRIPRGDTVVCRCENVTAEQVIAALRQGAAGPNQVKAFVRCGMGPCQGRHCGLTVTELVARERRDFSGARGIFPAALAGEADHAGGARRAAELGGSRARSRTRPCAVSMHQISWAAPQFPDGAMQHALLQPVG